jgi:endonuclease/exonuclease/phosphatase family metal-dependent hydrolase
VIRVATYNIHAAIGADRRRDLERIAAVIEEIGPDVIGLQEVESRASRGGSDQAMRLAAMLGMACVEGPMMLEGPGWYGNAILSRLPVLAEQRLRFPAHSGEPRGAVGVLVEDPQGGHWRLINTHLDLWSRSRLRQVQSLARLLENAGEPWSCSVISTNGALGRPRWPRCGDWATCLRRRRAIPAAGPCLRLIASSCAGAAPRDRCDLT